MLFIINELTFLLMEIIPNLLTFWKQLINLTIFHLDSASAFITFLILCVITFLHFFNIRHLWKFLTCLKSIIIQTIPKTIHLFLIFSHYYAIVHLEILDWFKQESLETQQNNTVKILKRWTILETDLIIKYKEETEILLALARYLDFNLFPSRVKYIFYR